MSETPEGFAFLMASAIGNYQASFTNEEYPNILYYNGYSDTDAAVRWQYLARFLDGCEPPDVSAFNEVY